MATEVPASEANAVRLDVGVDRRLRRDNAVAGGVHLVQAVAVLALATSFALPAPEPTSRVPRARFP